MMWRITKIEEADFGCEERLPGEPRLSLVSLENDDGDDIQFEVPDHWLVMQELVEGDEWPNEIIVTDEKDDKYAHQSQWWDNYMSALNEMDE